MTTINIYIYIINILCTMKWFQWCQWFKDSIAIPLFWAMSEFFSDSRAHLALFFAAGCFVDTLFVSWYLCQRKSVVTLASIKDVMGMFGMFVFCIALIHSSQVSGPKNWPYFFIVAILIDSISVLTICTRFNIYEIEILSGQRDNIVSTYDSVDI